MKNSQKRPVPQTADEANALMEAAIEDGDFEAAKEYDNQLKILQNFHEELNLAGTVHNYYQRKQVLSNNMENNSLAYKQQIDEGKMKSDQYFQNEFATLRLKQETELDALLDKWDAARNSFYGHQEEEYNQMMVTARLVAQQKKFDEAIKIKTLAERNMKARTKQKFKELDEQYRRQCDLLLKRQQQEINALAGRRQAEVRIFDALFEASETEALDAFLVNNASTVISIANRFKPDSFIPKSLSMQTVRSRPMAPKQSISGIDPEKSYIKRMDTVDRTLSRPLRTAPGRKASKFSPSRQVLTTKTEVEVNDSFSLTRSPLSSPISK